MLRGKQVLDGEGRNLIIFFTFWGTNTCLCLDFMMLQCFCFHSYLPLLPISSNHITENHPWSCCISVAYFEGILGLQIWAGICVSVWEHVHACISVYLNKDKTAIQLNILNRQFRAKAHIMLSMTIGNWEQLR